MTEINLDQIMSEIRASAEKRRRENPEIEQEIQRLRSYTPQLAYTDPRFYELDFNLHRANLEHSPGLAPGARFAFLKKSVLRLIRPYTHSQVSFNVALVRAVNKAWEIIQDQQKTIEDLQTRQETLEHHQQDLLEFVHTFNDFLLEDNRKEAIKRLTRIHNETTNTEIRLLAEQNRRFLETGSVPVGFDYLMFEERFRGPESEIKERQNRYVAYFQHCEPVLDIACGRGEFLELLRDNQIDGTGVENNPQMIARCREKNLSVVSADGFDHLEQLADETLGGIFSSQLIEHLNHIALARLLALTSSKLKTGGVLLLETINPASLFVHAHSLYLDPTHLRPYHPLCLEFLCRNFGFSRTELIFGSPVPEDWKFQQLPSGNGELDRALQRLNDLLYAPQDYAIVAYK